MSKKISEEILSKYTPPNPFKINEDLLGMLGKLEEVEEKTSTAKVVFNQILEKLNNE